MKQGVFDQSGEKRGGGTGHGWSEYPSVTVQTVHKWRFGRFGRFFVCINRPTDRDMLRNAAVHNAISVYGALFPAAYADFMWMPRRGIHAPYRHMAPQYADRVTPYGIAEQDAMPYGV